MFFLISIVPWLNYNWNYYNVRFFLVKSNLWVITVITNNFLELIKRKWTK